MKILPYVFVFIGCFYLVVAWNFRHMAISSLIPSIIIAIMCFIGAYLAYKKAYEKKK